MYVIRILILQGRNYSVLSFLAEIVENKVKDQSQWNTVWDAPTFVVTPAKNDD